MFNPVIGLIRARPRLILATAIGLGVWALGPSTYAIHTRGLIGFDAGVLFFVLASWRMMAISATGSIRQRAKMQDNGKWVVLALAAGAAVTALLAIGFEIHGAKDLGPTRQVLHIGLAVATIILAWLFIHTIFALHYAHEHFLEVEADGRTKGGLLFPGKHEPLYFDFLYFSFVIGMTGQTSDVAIAGSEMRVLALIQGVMAFFFNTVILALTINIAAGLI